MSINKTNPDIMLATTWDKIRDEKSRIYGKNSFLYRSTDGGRTWANIHNAPLPQSVDIEGQPVTATYVGRMGVDFSDSDPNRAYLDLQHGRRQLQRLLHEHGRRRDLDPGRRRRSGGTLQTISGGFAWWFGRVYVDPVNPQHVFVAGVSLAESLDGGLTWTTSQTRARRPARPRVGPVHAGQGVPRQRRRLLLVDRRTAPRAACGPRRRACR